MKTDTAKTDDASHGKVIARCVYDASHALKRCCQSWYVLGCLQLLTSVVLTIALYAIHRFSRLSTKQRYLDYKMNYREVQIVGSVYVQYGSDPLACISYNGTCLLLFNTTIPPKLTNLGRPRPVRFKVSAKIRQLMPLPINIST